ncbi:MAG: GntR family transcriptional regulator [Pseudomonadota bacterium]
MNSSVPLYVQVADRLRQRISSGVWVAGQLIPSLDGIAEEFGVARVTARQAVQLLSEEKLVLARRGIGTVVSQGVHTPRVVNLQTSLTDLAAMYESTHTEVLTFDEGSRKPPVSQEEGRLGESYVHMQRLHFTDGQPYAVISLYLLHSVFRADPEAFRSHAVIPLLVKMNVIERAHQTMQIGAAEAETARLLRVGAGAPVARVSRIFHTQGDLILYCAQVIYRGDWVRWDMDLKPQP